MLQRALRIDPQAAVRVRALGESAGDDAVEVFVTTPFDVVASRRCGGTAQPDGTVVSAHSLADKLGAARGSAGPAMLAAGGAALWPGALPPVSGFALIDEIPGEVLHELAQKGAEAAKDAGSVGIPTSLLQQQVLDVEGTPIVMRTVWALSQLDLLPTAADAAALGAQAGVVRVSRQGSWVRLDTVRGTVYQRSGGPLSLQPLR